MKKRIALLLALTLLLSCTGVALASTWDFVCPNCGASVRGYFCGNCGTANPAPPDSWDLEGHWKLTGMTNLPSWLFSLMNVTDSDYYFEFTDKAIFIYTLRQEGQLLYPEYLSEYGIPYARNGSRISIALIYKGTYTIEGDTLTIALNDEDKTTLTFEFFTF